MVRRGLTDRIEADAERIFDQIKSLARQAVPSGEHPVGEMTSGILRGIEDGWFIGEIADAAFAYQQALEKGDKRVVGVNVATAPDADELEILRISHQVELEQRAALGKRREDRDQAEVDRRIAAMIEVARGAGNMVEPMLDGRSAPRPPSARSATR